MKKILLLTATPFEADAMDNKIMGVEIHYTGVGKINAAIITTQLIEKHQPDVVVNFGSCATLHENDEIGKVYEVGDVHNDIDCTPLSEYGTTPFCGLSELQVNHGSTIQCLTTDRFYNKNRTDYSENFIYILKNKIDIIDMELYSIAQVCKRKELPLFSYKWVSDDGDPDEWLTNSKIGFQNFKELFLKNHFPLPKTKKK
jgi:adenosylhomocysteine nucleosidase